MVVEEGGLRSNVNRQVEVLVNFAQRIEPRYCTYGMNDKGKFQGFVYFDCNGVVLETVPLQRSDDVLEAAQSQQTDNYEL